MPTDPVRIDDDAAVQRLAAAIASAHARRATLSPPVPGPDLAEAYRVQEALLRRRLSRGERVAGWKLGYTSEVMRRQMGIDAPNLGALTDAMVLVAGDERAVTVPDTVTQPRAEPEVAVVLAADVPAGATRAAVLQRIRSAHACLEVVDSVWDDYRFRLEDNTADGSSAAYAVLGPAIPVDEVASVTVTSLHTVDGRESRWGDGVGADAFGHPADAVVWLAAALAERGDRLRAGQVVLTGGLTSAAPLARGERVRATFRFGSGEVEVAATR